MVNLIKLGEATVISTADIESADLVLADPEVLQRFEKIAADLKSIAPKAKDFLYFSAIMMHAAEAALLDGNGGLKKDASGQEVKASWDKRGDAWFWNCTDRNIKPYKNSNNDIFPEEELIKAYKKWIGRPLCLDHKSSSVDMIRGLIIDTYYDWPNKRVVALCALDKVNYPDLARKVATGYATSVSMGTAVGRAICFDCGNVARIESDFCDHMRHKSCYGEINVDLNPIELSIVVNGADPKAKIRHIVAAADNIAKYLEVKKQEFSKIAQDTQIIDETQHVEMAAEIRDGLEGVSQRIDELKEEVEALRRGEEAEQNHEHHKAANVQVTNKNSDSIKLSQVIDGIYQNLKDLRQDLSNLYQSKGEDNNMTKKNAYFLGGGGVNEPTPGKPRYEKEDSDSIRNNQDKQMEAPQDVGPVDGLFPGDEQKKRELNRLAAEREQRALRRQAAVTRAVQKNSWFQGGGGVNEPTPGKTKYPKEEAEKTREKEDKQMTGSPPFPGVGKPDGLYGDDLKKKEMLARAKLTAKFIKAANSDGTENLGESCWQIFADKGLILTATVADISGGKVDTFYDSIHSENFGRKILATIRTEGFDQAVRLFKKAAPPMETAPAAPAESAMPATMPASVPAAPQAGEAAVDSGGTGDPGQELPDLLDQAENTLADIRAGVAALTNSGNELANFDQLGEAAPSGEEAGGLPSLASSTISTQKKLGQALTLGMENIVKDLEHHVKELSIAQHIYDNKTAANDLDVKYLHELTREACDETKNTLAECQKIMRSFITYTDSVVLTKQAIKQMKMTKNAQTAPASYDVSKPAVSTQQLEGDPLNPVLPKSNVTPVNIPQVRSKQGPSKKPVPKLDPKIDPNSNVLPDPYPGHERVESNLINMTRDNPLRQAPMASQNQKADDTLYADDKEEMTEECNDTNDVVKIDKDGTLSSDNPEEAGKAMKAMKAAQFNLNTKEGRAQLRDKLGEKGIAFSDMLGKAHSGGVTTQLDIKPSGDLAKIETLEETHKAMLDLALAPPRVRKMAEDIQKLVMAGKINPATDLARLVDGGLDIEAVKYWKNNYGQTKNSGSQFTSDMNKEYLTKKMAVEKEAYKVKIARSYELAYEMARKGMIGDDRHALNQQVGELMSFNDEGFEGMKRHVERSSFSKKASTMPQVGMMGTSEILIPSPELAETNLVADYENLFANRRY